MRDDVTTPAGPAASPPRRLRVVHVINYMARSGGMEKGVSTLIRHASPDLEHIVVTIEGARDTDTALPKGTRHINLGKPKGNSLRFVWKLARLLRDLRPCVVHTRNWPGLDGIVAARLAGIHAVLHGEHGWSVDDASGTNRKRIMVRRFLSRWTRSFVCVSKDIERWLKETVRVRCPVIQIYNGVETAPFAGERTGAELRAEFGLPPDAPLLGIIGRLDPIKDHPMLFQAFAEVRRRFPTAELLVVGDGPEAPNLRKLLTPGIRMLGERHDVSHILRGLDVYVLSSKNEGISNTILEAMAAGVPVVAGRVGGNVELVEDGVTGRLVPAGDVAAFAEAICAYLASPELRAADGAVAKDRAYKRFRVEVMVRTYENAWRECAAAHI
ncbi:MAG: glycosyltransferase [Planctomycetota bacterium]